MNGYTPIDNDFLNKLMILELSGADMRVLLCIIRKTVFFKRFKKEMAVSLIQKNTNLSERQVRRSLKKLEDSEYISIQPAVGTHSQIITFRADNFGYQGGQIWSARADRTDHARADRTDHQEIKKENKYKENKKRKASPNIFPNFSADKYSIDELREWQEVLSKEDFDLFLKGKVWE